VENFIIGLDLDGVCYDFDSIARYMLREWILSQGREVPERLLYPSTHWDSIRECVTEDDWYWLWTSGVAAGLFRYGNVVSGAVAGAQELAQLGQVVAITVRPVEAVHDTIVWLATMLDKAPLSGVLIHSHGQAKSQVVPTPSVYVDDAVHNALDVIENTDAPVILFDQPWNHGFEHNRVYRAHGWRDVVEAVTIISEKKEAMRHAGV
jgi:uncharacterized HAD superfamily protein